MRRVVLELLRQGQWVLLGDVHEDGPPASLTVRPGQTITFGFILAVPLVFSSEPLLVTREVQVVDATPGVLANLNNGLYETEIERDGMPVKVRMRLQEAS